MYKFIIGIVISLIFTHANAINNLRTLVSVDELKKSNVKITKLLPEGNNEQFILELPDGTVINEGGILTAEGKILKDIQTSNSGNQHGLQNTKWDLNEDNPMYFNGRLAVISSSGSENWYHWLLQILPRLIILNESKIQYDRLYLNNIKFKWQQDSLQSMLKYLNIPDNKLLNINSNCILQAKTLIVPSVPFIPAKGVILPNWMKSELNKTYLKEDSYPSFDRVYISRSTASIRRIINEKELITELEKYNFKTIFLENLSPEEQASIFNKAKIIISPHGSSLANLIFIKPGCKIIEIDHGGDSVRSYFGQFTKIMGGIYHPFYVDNTTEEHWEDDMEIEVKSFMTYLNKIISSN